MYYEFYLQDGDKVQRYLVYSTSLSEAKEDFRVAILTEPNLKYRYSGNSYTDLKSYLHDYPNVDCYILKDGNIDPVSAPSYKSESRYDKMSKKLRKSIQEAVSNKQYRVYYKRKGQNPINLPSELVSANDEKSAETNFLSKFKNGGDIEIIKIYPIDESRSLRENTIGLYGDDSSDLGDYADLSTFISSCKKRGISVSDVEDNGSNGWELNLSGDPRIIYSLVNNRVRGYNKDSLSEFIDEYSLDESRSLREADQSFTIEYREDGKTKYSSVRANSESEALNKFRDITKDRNVSGAKIAATDVTDDNTLTEATIEDYDALENQCRSDLSDILDGREFWTRVEDMEEYLQERGYSLLDTGNFPESIEIEDGEGNQFTLDVNSAGEGRSFTVYFGECSFINESKKFRESMGDIIDLHTMTREQFDNLPSSSSFTRDRGDISVDGKRYVKISTTKWEYIPTVTHALGYTLSCDKMWDIIQKGKSAQMVENKKLKEAGGPSTWKGLDTGDSNLDSYLRTVINLTNSMRSDLREHDMMAVLDDLRGIKDYAEYSIKRLEGLHNESKNVSVRENIKSVFKK